VGIVEKENAWDSKKKCFVRKINNTGVGKTKKNTKKGDNPAWKKVE